MGTTADYFFYDLEDYIIVDNKLKPIPDSHLRLTTMMYLDFPNELNVRPRRGPFKLRKDMWDAHGRVYLVNTIGKTEKYLLRSKVRFDGSQPFVDVKDGLFLETLKPYLPTMAYANLTGDAIPATSWGASLYRMLTSAQWATIRATTIDRCNGRCEICGVSGAKECHEHWEYHEPTPNSVSNWGVQRLRKLTNLCSRCHLAHHLGFANRQGRLAEAMNYLRDINQWDSIQVEQYLSYVQTSWVRRSTFGWLLDLGFLPDTKKDNSPLILNSRWIVEANGFISASTPYGNTKTKLLWIDWQAIDGSIRYTQGSLKKLSNLPIN
jgi:hypothetical protein